MSSENEVRDAVIKLEAKMEQIVDMMSTMTTSVAKIADMGYEVREIKKDVKRLADALRDVTARLDCVETYTNKNTFVNKGLLHGLWLIGAAIIGYISYHL